MLEEIRITGLGVIESSTLELGPGAHRDHRRDRRRQDHGRDRARAAARGPRRQRRGAHRAPGPRGWRASFAWPTSPGVAAAVDDAGGEVEDDRVVLARNVSAEGRSRAFVGGASVPVSRLAEVAEPLVAVHGQSDQHRLLQPRAQRDALDRFGGEATADPAGRLPHAPRRLRDHRARAGRGGRDRPRAGPRGRPAAVRARRDRGGRARAGRGRPPWPRRSSGSGTPTRCAPPPSGPRGALVRRRQARRPGRGVGRPHPARRGPRARHRRPASSPTGWPRSPTCCPTSRPTSRRTPRGWRPTRPGWRPSRSDGRR